MARRPSAGKGSNQYQSRGRSQAQTKPLPSRDEVRSAIESEQVAAVFAGDGYDAKRARKRSDVYRHAGSPDYSDRERIAKRASTPPEILDVLADDTSPEVRRAVAANPNTPPAALSRLSGLEPERVAENPNTATATLDWLINDNRLKHTGRNVLHAALAHPNCPPQWLADWSTGDATYHPDLDHVALANPACPPEVLGKVASDFHQGLSRHRIAAANPSCPVDVLSTLARRRDTGQAQALANPSCPVDVLEEVYASGGDAGRHVAQNPNLPRRLRNKAAYKYPMSPAALTAAADPECATDVLEEIAMHGSVEAKRAVAANPKTSAYLLGELRYEPDWRIQIAVARNPHTPLDHVNALQVNGSALRVRDEARRLFQERSASEKVS